MTAQITVQLCVSLHMACNAEIHLEINSPQSIHRRNITMARQTVDLRGHMRTMPEFHKIRNEVDSNPGHRHLFIEIFFLFNDLGMCRNYILVAKETLFNFRQSRMFSTFNVWMAETAIDLFDACMYAVAEIDRLNRPDVLSREKVK